jgi:DNA-nicking Smr family endonuclease
VARSAEPLAPRRRPQADTAQSVKSAAETKPGNRPPPAKPLKLDRPAPVKATTTATPTAGIDRRTRTQLARGARQIDARIDMHGLTQSLAHQRLRRFLEDAQAGGAKLVLVITGKGKPLDAVTIGEERGILRRAVPGWLSGTELRHLVAGFDEADRRHGGGGALYVRIKRKK